MTPDTSQPCPGTPTGEHFYVRESDGVYVCQPCGAVKPSRRVADRGTPPSLADALRDSLTAAAGRGTPDGDTQ